MTTADIAGAASFDLLRVTAIGGQRDQAPYGTGNFAVLTNVARASVCSKGMCTFTDTQAYSNSGAAAHAATSTLDLCSDERPTMQRQKNEWKANRIGHRR